MSPGRRAKGRQSDFSGFVLLDKPVGMTSFQALYSVKKQFQTRRVGHAGTLDLQASGLLVAAVGKSTRLLSVIEAQNKQYQFRLHLGRTTETLEWVGELFEGDPQGARTAAQIQGIIPTFLGAQKQRPPEYSAIKIAGKRASDRALRGETVVLSERDIQIHQLGLVSEHAFEPVHEFDFLCDCSKGTYIRALGRDMGKALGTEACVSRIRRTQIGCISVTEAQKPGDTLLLRKVSDLMDWPVVMISARQKEELMFGRRIAWSGFPGNVLVAHDDDIYWAGFCDGNSLAPRILLR